MNRIRQALSQIGEILVLYLRLLLLTIVVYAIIYGYLRCFESTSIADVENDHLASQPAATRYDL